MMIREARLRAGLSQGDLGARVGRDRAQIARWERDAVQPSFETLRELVRACGFDLAMEIVSASTDETAEARVRATVLQSPQERVQSMLESLTR